MKAVLTRLEQEKRKKWLLDYILYEESEDEEARQLAIENMYNVSYDEFREGAIQSGIKFAKEDEK